MDIINKIPSSISGNKDVFDQIFSVILTTSYGLFYLFIISSVFMWPNLEFLNLLYEYVIDNYSSPLFYVISFTLTFMLGTLLLTTFDLIIDLLYDILFLIRKLDKTKKTKTFVNKSLAFLSASPFQNNMLGATFREKLRSTLSIHFESSMDNFDIYRLAIQFCRNHKLIDFSKHNLSIDFLKVTFVAACSTTILLLYKKEIILGLLMLLLLFLILRQIVDMSKRIRVRVLDATYLFIKTSKS